MNIIQKQELIKKFLLKNRQWENIYPGDLICLLRKLFAYKHIKIGILPQKDESNQATTYIVYIVRQLGKDFFYRPIGSTACIRLRSSENISYELSNWFSKQYPFWENKPPIKFIDLPLFIEEIMFFLKKGEVKDKTVYIMHENAKDKNFPDILAWKKQILDQTKKQQLNRLFGFFKARD